MNWTQTTTADHHGDPNEMLERFKQLWDMGEHERANRIRIAAKDLHLNATVKQMNQHTDAE